MHSLDSRNYAGRIRKTKGKSKGKQTSKPTTTHTNETKTEVSKTNSRLHQMQITKSHSIQTGEVNSSFKRTPTDIERQQTFSSQSQRPMPHSFRQIVHHACEPVHIDKFDELMQRQLHKCGLLKSFPKKTERTAKS